MKSSSKAKQRWVGLDWGDAKHSLSVQDLDGNPMDLFEVDHDSDGMTEMINRLRRCGEVLGVAVETPNHLVVQQLLLAGFPVYPVNPKVAKAWRDGFRAQASKTDRIDAWILADGLRHHHAGMKTLTPDDPQTRELAMLCADEISLIQDRAACVQRLRAILKQYYPQALEWFSDLSTPIAWDFVLIFSSPEKLLRATDKKIIGFFKTHRSPLTPKRKQQIDQRTKPQSWRLDESIDAAKQEFAIATVKQLRTLEASLQRYRKRINEIFADHPDRAIFESLPGAGEKLAPRLLALFGSRRDRFESADEVKTLSGTAPVSSITGNQKKPTVKFRWACRTDYRNTMHQFAWCSTNHCGWANTFFHQARAKEQKYGLALRNLGGKWLKIIFRMWQERIPYDEARYLNAMIQHGSPLIRKMKQTG